MMKAAVIESYGSPQVITIKEMPRPELKGNEVLVKVRAVGVNPVDCKIRAGNMQLIHKAKMPFILGFDFSGIVASVGQSVKDFKEGDEVFGRAPGASYAEYVAVPQKSLTKKPSSVSFETAAAAPVVAVTTTTSLIDHCNVKSGQRILIFGGAGGVGSYAVKLSKYLGLFVATTCSASNVDYVKSLGADQVIDYRSQDFETAVEGKFNVVFDCVGGDDYYNKACRIMSPGAIYLTIVGPNLYGGSEAITAGVLLQNVAAIAKHKMYSLFGGPRYEFLAKMNDEHLPYVASLMEQGIVPEVEKVMPLEEVAAAHEAIETHHSKGKIVLIVNKDM